MILTKIKDRKKTTSYGKMVGGMVVEDPRTMGHTPRMGGSPKKGGSGGGPKNRQILHTGGGNLGGGVFGGVPEQGLIKHEVL